MKKYIYTAFILFISFVVSAQTLYTTKRDSIPAQNNFFTLQSNQYRGIIQWQKSLDGKIWNDISGQNQPQLIIPTSTEAFYRAKLTEGDCFETYSDSAVILMHKVQNTTVDPKTISGAILVKTDGNTFTYKNIGNIQLAPGTLLLATDSASNIRIVTSTMQKNDTLIVQTIQGSMADIFLNTSFNLTTASASNQQNIKGLSKTQQSKALTDENGFIHPVFVRNNNFEKQKAKNATMQDNGIPMLRFGDDFSGDTIYYNNGMLLKFSSGNYSFNSELKCEFKFEQPHFDFKNLKINAGRLKRFSFYTDPDVTGVDTKLILLAKAGGEKEFEKEITLKENVLNKSFEFLVGEVPVWMDVTIDLMAKASGSISSELSVSGGASASAHASLGATYENGVWTPINTFTKTFTLYGPDIIGKANEEFRVEVYPHISVMFYKLIGPWLDIAPYVSQEINVSISGNSDFELYGGTDARLGIDVTGFDKELADLNHEFILRKDTLYQTPYKLKLLSGDNQSGEAGVALTDTIVLQALDSRNNPITNYPVNLQSLTGSTNTILNTNSSGKVNVKWTLGDVEGEQKLEAYLKNGKDEKIATADTIVKANCKSNTPTVITTAVSNIDETIATCGGTVTKNGGAAVTARGVCWNVSGTPTIADNKTVDGTGDGSFISNLTGLTVGTTYYVRAYATNKNGTAYGETLSFTTVCDCTKKYGTFTDPRDGHVYKTITIGTQTWMAENLAYLPVAASNVTVGSEDSGNEGKPFYYVYDLAKYGVLYNWYAALTAAPPGWHLSTDAEWTILNTRATNYSCFSALPGGGRYYNSFAYFGHFGHWWSSTQLGTSGIWGWSLADTMFSYLGQSNGVGYYGCSVRCVKD